jgi:O-antigen/teichoic acid export membrane protein
LISRAVAAGRRFTGGMSADTRAGLSGLTWSYLSHGVQLVFRFGSSLILTRLLMPDVYGVFGPALSVLIFIEFLSDIGLRPIVGRSPNGESPDFLGTAWTIVVVRGAALSLAVVGLSFVLPSVYDKPAMGPVLLALAVRPFLWSFQNPTLFVLFRRLEYRQPFILDVTQTLVYVPVTILLAVALGNVWALVLGMLIGDLYRIVMTHVLCPRAPGFRWHRPSVAEFSHFGVSIFLNTLVYGAWLYFDRLSSPRVLTETELGWYLVAWNLAEGLDNLIGRASEVFYSMLNRKPDEQDRRAFYQRTVRRLALFLIPVLALGAVTAPLVFRLLYTTDYHPAGVLLGLLIARLIFRAVGQLQFMYLMMRAEVIVSTRAYVFAFLTVAAAFVIYGLVRGWDAFTPLYVALSAVGGMAAYVVGQTIQMRWRKEGSPWPLLIGLAWTAVAVAGVLLTSR